MDALRSAGKDGAILGSGIANGDHGVEVLTVEFGNGFGALRGDVDADCTHSFDGHWADVAVGPGSGTVDIKGVAA
jgi:hypothetical protein